MTNQTTPAEVRSNDGLGGFPAITEPMRAAGGAVIEQILSGNADPDSTWNDAANVFAAMLAAAPQPAERVPLTEEEIAKGHGEVPEFSVLDVVPFALGVRFAERAHRIKPLNASK